MFLYQVQRYTAVCRTADTEESLELKTELSTHKKSTRFKSVQKKLPGNLYNCIHARGVKLATLGIGICSFSQ